MEIKTKLLFLGTSALSSNLVITPTSYATTTSLSELNFDLKDFNQIPLENNNSNAGDNIAISGNKTSTVTAKFDGGLDFVVNNSTNFITGDSQSQAFGEGTKYFGISPLSSQALGNYSLGGNESFSFEFEATLKINNSVTTPDTGSIHTLAGASFFLVDSKTQDTLDFFRVVGDVKTNLLGGENTTNQDILFREGSSNVSFIQAQADKSFGGLTESAQANVTGSFNRFFDTPTDFTLYVNTINRSCVQTPVVANPCVQIPEPSTIGALACGVVWLGILRFAKRLR